MPVTSPASSVSPQMLPDAHGSGFIKVVSASSSPVWAPDLWLPLLPLSRAVHFLLPRSRAGLARANRNHDISYRNTRPKTRWDASTFIHCALTSQSHVCIFLLLKSSFESMIIYKFIYIELSIAVVIKSCVSSNVMRDTWCTIEDRNQMSCTEDFGQGNNMRYLRP